MFRQLHLCLCKFYYVLTKVTLHTARPHPFLLHLDRQSVYYPSQTLGVLIADDKLKSI